MTLFDLLNPGNAESQRPSILKLPGNVLDVAFVSDEHMVVSVDNIHRPGNTTDIDDSDESDESGASKVSIYFQHSKQRLFPTQEAKPRLLAFKYDAENPALLNWGADEHTDRTLISLNRQTTVSWHEKGLQALLYPIGHLRKLGTEAVED